MNDRADIAAARRAFPVLDEIVYLNTGTMGIMAEPVADRYLALLRDFEVRGLAAEPEARRWADVARTRLAVLLHVTPDEIALTGNATDGLAYVAAAIPWSPGDEVLISDQEHPAMVFPFTYAQQQGKLRLRRFHIAVEPGETADNLRAALVPGQTKLVAFSQVTSQTGTRLPAAALAEAAQAAGAWCFLDATQSVGQLPPSELDLPSLGADFATSNGHKWLGAAKGTGFLYVRRALLDHLTPAHVGAGALRWPAALGDAPAAGAERQLEPVPSARRFEYGTRNWMLYASIPLALDWLESFGWEAVVSQERRLAQELRAALRAVPGVTPLTPEPWDHSAAMTTFAVPVQDCLDLARRLWDTAQLRVRTVPELDALRVSTAYYNNRHDLERLLAALHSLVRET
ncbi:MAG: aminotransferase class V-fold PLP-dependent enzyme [Chloroflexota bacterium]